MPCFWLDLGDHQENCTTHNHMSKFDAKNILITAAVSTVLAGAGSFYVGFEEGHKAGASFQMKSLFYAFCYSSLLHKAGGPEALSELINTPAPKNPLEAAKYTDKWAKFNEAREQCNQKLGIKHDDDFWRRRSL